MKRHLLIPSLLLASLSAWGAGNGVSYSGPDLSGSSVGPSTEIKASLDQIVALTNKCSFAMLKKFWEAQNNQDFYTAARNAAPYVEAPGPHPIDGGENAPPPDDDTIRKTCLVLDYQPSSCQVSATLGLTPWRRDIVLTFSKCDLKPASLSIAVPPSADLPGAPDHVQAFTQSPIPAYSVTGDFTNSSYYDAWGRYIPSRGTMPVTFKLGLPNGALDGTLINQNTQIATQYSMDLNGYAQCLRQAID